MKIYSVLNQKGGSGKSSLTILIALSLAAIGKKVIIVDCDPQGGSTSLLSPLENEDISRPGLFDIICANASISNTIIPVKRNDLSFDLIPSDCRLDQIAFNMDPYSLKRIFKNFNTYDYMILDNPPTVQGISRASCILADRIYVPADISAQTFGPTAFTIESLKDIEKKASVIFVGYKEPEADSNGYMAKLSRKFVDKFKTHYVGSVPKNATTAKIIADPTVKLTKSKIEQLFNPLIEILEK